MMCFSTLLPLLSDDLEADAAIDISSYDMLLHTYEAGESGIRMTDLAERLVVSKSGLTARVDRLEERGLLQRVADSEDRRAIRIALTPDGLATFRKAATIHLKGIEDRFVRYVTERQAEAMLAAFAAVAEQSSVD